MAPSPAPSSTNSLTVNPFLPSAVLTVAQQNQLLGFLATQPNLPAAAGLKVPSPASSTTDSLNPSLASAVFTQAQRDQLLGFLASQASLPVATAVLAMQSPALGMMRGQASPQQQQHLLSALSEQQPSPTATQQVELSGLGDLARAWNANIRGISNPSIPPVQLAVTSRRTSNAPNFNAQLKSSNQGQLSQSLLLQQVLAKSQQGIPMAKQAQSQACAHSEEQESTGIGGSSVSALGVLPPRDLSLLMSLMAPTPGAPGSTSPSDRSKSAPKGQLK